MILIGAAMTGERYDYITVGERDNHGLQEHHWSRAKLYPTRTGVRYP